MMLISSLGRDAGSGSRLQDLGKDVLMIFRTSSSSTTPKFDKKGAPCDSSVGCCESTVSWPIQWLICVLAVVFQYFFGEDYWLCQRLPWHWKDFPVPGCRIILFF